ncbi:alpha/beta hydrolase [Actinophytocola gossypii]|nr:alpha/beta hydrolase [Actinophytocola gossypii]
MVVKRCTSSAFSAQHRRRGTRGRHRGCCRARGSRRWSPSRSYLFGANQCLNDAVTTYLTTGERPAEDLVCS